MTTDQIFLLNSIKGAAACILWALAFHGKPLDRNHLVVATGYQRDTVTKGLQNLKALDLIEYGGRSQGWYLTGLIDQYELPGLFPDNSLDGEDAGEDSLDESGEEAENSPYSPIDPKAQANKPLSKHVPPPREADFSPLGYRGSKDRANKSPHGSGDQVQEAKKSPQKTQTPGCEAKKSSLAVYSVNAFVKPSPTNLKNLDQDKRSLTTTHLTDGVDPKLLRAFRSAGLIMNPRTRALALLPHITPGYVRAHHAQLKANGKASHTGLLITILESGQPAPEIYPNGHLKGCTCDECTRKYRYHLP